MGVDWGRQGSPSPAFLLFSSFAPNTSCVLVRTPSRDKLICCPCEPVGHLRNTCSASVLRWERKRPRGGRGRPHVLSVAAQPVLYWCARNMSFWSSISFNLAVLMNLLVAFFYPFRGVRGGTASTSGEPRGAMGGCGLPLACAPISDKRRWSLLPQV